MTLSDVTVAVPAHDSGSVPAFVFLPASRSGPGLVLLQEIFGVTEYISSRARDLANLGYVVVVPELYWRLGEHITTDETTEAGLQEAFGYMSRLDVPQAVDDAVATVEHTRTLPFTGGKAGVMGFCLGGRLAYEVGVASDPDVVVSYYGSGIADRLSEAPKLTSPVIFHFGGADNFLPAEQSERIAAAFASRPDAEMHTQPGAGHAFDNFRAPIFYNADAASAAWPLTADFLKRSYPTDRR
jgi:carboxymethylenebutenolidase